MAARTPWRRQVTLMKAVPKNKTNIWSTINQWQRTPQEDIQQQSRERPAIHWTCAITLGGTVQSANSRVRGAFSRCAPVVPEAPTQSVFPSPFLASSTVPSRLIPPCSAPVDELCGGSSSCGNWYNVAEQQRERSGKPGEALHSDWTLSLCWRHGLDSGFCGWSRLRRGKENAPEKKNTGLTNAGCVTTWWMHRGVLETH